MPLAEAAEDVTLKQYSGLAALFQSQAAPYVDFATFGPYGLRIEKKSRFSGLKMGSDGNLHQVEMFGPPTFAKYKECWKPFRTGCIMLDERLVIFNGRATSQNTSRIKSAQVLFITAYFWVSEGFSDRSVAILRSIHMLILSIGSHR